MKSDHASDSPLPMHPLQRALIEKAGHDNGFEYVLPGDAQPVALASARHPARVRVAMAGQGYEVGIDTGSATLAQELARTFATSQTGATTFVLSSEALLAHWLRRAAALSQAPRVRHFPTFFRPCAKARVF
jgi:putative restriction endonuclease